MAYAQVVGPHHIIQDRKPCSHNPYPRACIDLLELNIKSSSSLPVVLLQLSYDFVRLGCSGKSTKRPRYRSRFHTHAGTG